MAILQALGIAGDFARLEVDQRAWCLMGQLYPMVPGLPQSPVELRLRRRMADQVLMTAKWEESGRRRRLNS
ncbi:MAG TPA: hypothetical protein DEQ28_00390 [Clostridiales bacterium]|nr:hypothetical protein [Clostridiales bacterium]